MTHNKKFTTEQETNSNNRLHFYQNLLQINFRDHALLFELSHDEDDDNKMRFTEIK